jgi:hypothetical protein
VIKGKNFRSFQTLLATRHADSLAKCICASKEVMCQPPRKPELWNQSTK